MIVLIPAYEPDQRLVDLVDGLRGAGQAVVVVDDGSGPAYAPVFQAVRDLGGTVLTHPVNRGKGAALKTGFRSTREDVVCADADGQHRVEDILRVADHVRRTGRTTLGVRRFTGPVPLRSSAGNALTRVVFAAVTGSRIQDTQTGLRGTRRASSPGCWTCRGTGSSTRCAPCCSRPATDIRSTRCRSRPCTWNTTRRRTSVP
ncbi:glycosyltransferase family 2 protein [Dactylosporangium cerinum]